MPTPSANRSRPLPGAARVLWACAALVLALVALAACGGGDDDGSTGSGTTPITWYQGTAPAGEVAAPATSGDAAQAPTVAAVPTLSAATDPTATIPPAAAPTQAPAVTGTILTPEELAQYQPNELGAVPVLMYHNILPEVPADGDPVLYRSIADFTADLQWLYDNGFYLTPFHEYITNSISAPAGKKPVVLTFDDSRPNQLYYLVGSDGSVTIDPNSVVAILDAFSASHPGFGKAALFSILPSHCFDFEEPTQTPYCQDKLQYLVENGYEIGNHTYGHTDLGDVTNDVFTYEVGYTTTWLDQQAPGNDTSTVLVLPYGVFPQGTYGEDQWQYIRNGFTYEGTPIQLLSVVAAGANPAPSPNSVLFDPMSIARIGGKDGPDEGQADLFLDFWFGQFAADPGQLYVSDGNPDTVTVPLEQHWSLVDTLDADKVAADGKQLIEY